jgi:hypothetical protein
MNLFREDGYVPTLQIRGAWLVLQKLGADETGNTCTLTAEATRSRIKKSSQERKTQNVTSSAELEQRAPPPPAASVPIQLEL